MTDPIRILLVLLIGLVIAIGAVAVWCVIRLHKAAQHLQGVRWDVDQLNFMMTSYRMRITAQAEATDEQGKELRTRITNLEKFVPQARPPESEGEAPFWQRLMGEDD